MRRRGWQAQLKSGCRKLVAVWQACRRTREWASQHLAGHGLRWVLLGVSLLAVYPIAITTLLWSGLLETWLKRDSLSVEIDGPTWSVLPGRVHVRALRVYVNNDTQVLISLENAELDIDLLALMDKEFSVSSLRADGVRFRLRTRVEQAKLNTLRVKALPDIEGLPGDASLVRKEDDGSEGGGMKWTVQIRGIDVPVSELWFFEYRYVGSGRVRGGFMLSPNRLRVDPSVQDVSGELRFGQAQVLVSELQGRVSAEIPEFDRDKEGGIGVLRAMNAKANLDAKVRSIEPLSAYLDGLKLSDGPGPLQLSATLNDGRIEPGSKLTYSTEKLRASGDNFEFESDAELNLDLAPRKASGKSSKAPANRSDAKAGAKSDSDQHLRLSSSAKSSYISFLRPGKEPFTLQLHSHEQLVLFNSERIDALKRIESATLEFPNIQTTDLDDLAAWSDEIQVTKQTDALEASLRLELRKRGEWGGPLDIRFDPVSLRFKKARARVGGEAKCWLQYNPEQKILSLGDLSLKLQNVSFHVGDWDAIDDWWMQLSAKRFSLMGMPPDRYQSDVSVRAKDAEPLLQMLAEKSELPDAVAMLMSLSDLRARAELQKDDKTLDLMVDALESSVIDVAGRLYEAKGDRRLALVLGGNTISLGIHQYRGNMDFELQAGAPWLNRQLAKFPGPNKQVGSPRP